MGKLTESEIKEKLNENPAWKRTEGKWITRKYRFQDYLNGIEFVQAIAQLSEQVNHHPFISIDYKLVTLKLSSWHANGLTELDFEMARQYEDLYKKIKKDMVE